MESLPETTKRRLKKIPQTDSVWEGDRRPVSKIIGKLETNLEKQGECVIWVDATEGFVRTMEMVKRDMGSEIMVRTLIQAIENPHSPGTVSRPKKIVVKDREIQFFLRGILQDLDIKVEYVPNLILIDELWQNFSDMKPDEAEEIPIELENLLDASALKIWEQEPWNILTDQDIIKIDLNLPEIETLYACVMGMLGKEYGVIFYRSLDSLTKFRNALLKNSDEIEIEDQLESTFLQQDCWFLNFATEDDNDLNFFKTTEVEPLFGSIHPYEGMSRLRDEEEFLPIYLALQGLYSFVNDFEEDLSKEKIDYLTKEYTFELPFNQELLTVTISSTPQLTIELDNIVKEIVDHEDAVLIRDDLVPKESLIFLTVMRQSLLELILKKKNCYIWELKDNTIKSYSEQKDGFPVVLIQTTRPKAKILIEKIQAEKGVEFLTFNPGIDNYDGTEYDLGILKTNQNNLYLVNDFAKDELSMIQFLKTWQDKVKECKGDCGILIATGAKGASRLNPTLKEFIALFQTKLISHKDLDLGVLVFED